MAALARTTRVTVNLADILHDLHRLEIAIENDFRRRNKREPEFADKVKKIVEEAGEIIKAHKKWRQQNVPAPGLRWDVVDEIWDGAIAYLSIGAMLGFTDEEMVLSLNRVLAKLESRWPEAKHLL